MERAALRPSLGSRLGQGFSNALTSLALVPPRIFAASLTAVALFSTGLFMALLLIDAFELARAGIRTDAPIPTVVVVLISFVICVTVEFVGGRPVIRGVGHWRQRVG